jgi:hypothetical protein
MRTTRGGLIRLLAIAGVGSALIFGVSYYSIQEFSSTKKKPKALEKIDATAEKLASKPSFIKEKDSEPAPTKEIAKPKDSVSESLKDDSDSEEESTDVATASVSTELCANLEFVTQESVEEIKGPKPEEWSKLMARFHSGKRKLVKWLKSKKTELSPDAYEFLVERVKGLRIQRPPTAEEPDLNYRGIAAMSRDGADEPLIRVGAGFLKLVQLHPAEAEFQLTRLLVQSLVPCELEKEKIASPWKPVMECLGVAQTDLSCSPQMTHEGGWALSTAVAYKVSPPGCQLKAFTDEKMASCLKDFKLTQLPTEVREARR